MPRQIDLTPGNLQVTHNPNDQLAISGEQLTNYQNQMPARIAQAQQAATTEILKLIDDATGLNLVGLQTWLQQFVDSIVKLFNPTAGTGNNFAAINAAGLGALGGIFSALTEQGDGTADVLANIVENGDGTAEVMAGPYMLFEGNDGTAMNVAQLWNDFVTSVNGIKHSQQVLDTIVQSIFQNPVATTNSIEALGTAMTQFPVDNVLGYQTGTTLAETFQSTWDAFAGSWQIPAGASLADIANHFTQTINDLGVAMTMAQGNATYVQQQAVNSPGHHAVDPSLNAVFDVTTLSATAPTTVDVTPTASVIGFIHLPAAATKATVVWYGGGVTDMTAAYLNIYSVDTTGTGDLPYLLPFLLGSSDPCLPIWQSGNIIGAIGGSLDWIYVPITVPLTSGLGNWYAVELQFVGTGTHTMVGMPNHWLGPNPNVTPQQLGASRMTQRTPAFDAAGAYGRGSATATWTDPAAAGEYVVAQTVGYSSAPTGCTLDGVAMTPLAGVDLDNVPANGTLQFYGGVAVGADPHTLVATVTSGIVAGNSMSYADVAYAESLTNAYGYGSVAALTETGIVGSVVIAGFAFQDVFGGQTATTSGGTQRMYDHPAGGGTNVYDAVTSGTVGVLSFSSTCSGATYWGAAAIRLVGTPVAAPTSLNPVYSPHVPWLALSSESVGTHGVNLPATSYYGMSGTHTYLAPPWAAFVDMIPLGAGGGGSSNYGYTNGGGGWPGAWQGLTLTVGGTGRNSLLAGSTVTVTVGAGGLNPGFYFMRGSPGGATTVAWTDGDGNPQTLTAAGGAGGDPNHDAVPLTNWGGSPGGYTFNGKTYQGGSQTLFGSGNAPGGGGCGAGAFSFGLPGAAGGAWMVARQT